MPILLVLMENRVHPDITRQGLAGHVADVLPDDHEFGGREAPAFGKFGHIKVLDRTYEEAKAYALPWRHDPVVTQVSATGDERLIEVVSTMVSNQGKHAFQRDAVEQLLADIGGNYVSHNGTGFRFSITATLEQRDGIVAKITSDVQRMQYRARVWTVNAAGLDYLRNNDGYVEGNATQISGFLSSGLDD